MYDNDCYLQFYAYSLTTSRFCKDISVSNFRTRFSTLIRQRQRANGPANQIRNVIWRYRRSIAQSTHFKLYKLRRYHYLFLRSELFFICTSACLCLFSSLRKHRYICIPVFLYAALSSRIAGARHVQRVHDRRLLTLIRQLVYHVVQVRLK